MRLLLVLIALVLVFAAVTLWRAARNEAASEAAYPPSGEIIDVEGTKIHAVVKGSGPDLVLIHGASGSARDLTFSLVDKLAADYRVITFDRPGFGYSDRLAPKGETIFAQAGILKKAAAQLGATAPIVVGQSYGGSVALAWATKHPEDLSALVTLAAPALPWNQAEAPMAMPPKMPALSMAGQLMKSAPLSRAALQIPFIVFIRIMP